MARLERRQLKYLRKTRYVTTGRNSSQASVDLTTSRLSFISRGHLEIFTPHPTPLHMSARRQPWHSAQRVLAQARPNASRDFCLHPLFENGCSPCFRDSGRYCCSCPACARLDFRAQASRSWTLPCPVGRGRSRRLPSLR